MPEPASATAGWPARPGRRASARLGAAMLLHVLLLWALWTGLDRIDLRRPAREVWTTLLAGAERRATATAPARAAPAAAAPRARGETRRPRVPTLSPAIPSRSAPDVDAPAITLPPAMTASAALAAAPPASAPSAPPGSLLDTAATRAAIRAIARGPLLSERAVAATGLAPAAGAGERLARDVDAAQRGDCLHGGFAGGGAGLLSLPFLAAAIATGQCGK
jgi:hypothetical protein